MHRKIHRRVEESDVVQLMWCHRSLGRRLLTACLKPQEEIPSAKGKGKSRRFRREKSNGKGRGGSSNYPIVDVYNDGSKKSNVTYEGSSWIRGSRLWCCQESVWSETCRSDGTDM